MKKCNYQKEREEARAETAQVVCWCMIIALHQEEGIGETRINRCAKILNDKQQRYAMKVFGSGRDTAVREMKRRLEGICDTEFRIPQLRAPKSGKERELLQVKNDAATVSWLIMADTVREVLHFGTVRLQRMKKNTFDNYEQFLGWYGAGTRDEKYFAFDKLRQCVERAIGEKVDIVEDENSGDVFASEDAEYMKEEHFTFLWAGQDAKAEAAAKKNGTLLLSDAEMRRKCAEISSAVFGGGNNANLRIVP